MILGEGLEENEMQAFSECASLHEISIPHAVKSIKDRAVACCSKMTTFNLGDGLE